MLPTVVEAAGGTRFCGDVLVVTANHNGGRQQQDLEVDKGTALER